MKKIVIINGHNTYNYGTFMMLINFIRYTYEKSNNKRIEFVIDFLYDSDYGRLRKELNNDNIKVSYWKSAKNPPTPTPIDKLKKLGFMLFKFNKEILSFSPDRVIVLGGDDFSEYYGKLPVAIYMKILMRLNKKVPLFFVGQTLGPFTTYNKKIAHNLFSAVNTTLRDTLCFDYMKNEIGVSSTKMKSFADLAFLELPLQPTINKLGEYNLVSKEYITIVSSGLYFKYTSDRNKYISTIIDLTKYLLEKYPNKKIVFLGHVLLPEIASDNNIINDIKRKLGDSDRVKYITDKMLASEARSILGGGYFTLTGRMHAAISTLQTKTPAISLSYSVKYKGIIDKDMGLGELVVEAKGDALWSENTVFNNTIKAINNLEDNWTTTQEKIYSSVDKMEELSKDNIEYFIEKI